MNILEDILVGFVGVFAILFMITVAMLPLALLFSALKYLGWT